MVQITPTATNQTSKYFLFYHQLPESPNKETVQQLIKPLIHYANFQVFMDHNEHCFEIIVFSKENQKILLSNPIVFNAVEISASLKSKKICKHNQYATR